MLTSGLESANQNTFRTLAKRGEFRRSAVFSSGKVVDSWSCEGANSSSSSSSSSEASVVSEVSQLRPRAPGLLLEGDWLCQTRQRRGGGFELSLQRVASCDAEGESCEVFKYLLVRLPARFGADGERLTDKNEPLRTLADAEKWLFEFLKRELASWPTLHVHFACANRIAGIKHYVNESPTLESEHYCVRSPAKLNDSFKHDRRALAPGSALAATERRFLTSVPLAKIENGKNTPAWLLPRTGSSVPSRRNGRYHDSDDEYENESPVAEVIPYVPSRFPGCYSGDNKPMHKLFFGSASAAEADKAAAHAALSQKEEQLPTALPVEVFSEKILPFLNRADLQNLAQASGAFRELAEERLGIFFELPQLTCFFTKQGFSELKCGNKKRNWKVGPTRNGTQPSKAQAKEVLEKERANFTELVRTRSLGNEYCSFPEELLHLVQGRFPELLRQFIESMEKQGYSEETIVDALVSTRPASSPRFMLSPLLQDELNVPELALTYHALQKGPAVENLLGVGVFLQSTGFQDQQEFQCIFDIMSYTAFHSLGHREAVFDTKHRLEGWLPIAIDRQHFKRVLPLLMHKLQAWARGASSKQTTTTSKKFAKAKCFRGAQSYAEWLDMQRGNVSGILVGTPSTAVPSPSSSCAESPSFSVATSSSPREERQGARRAFKIVVRRRKSPTRARVQKKAAGKSAFALMQELEDTTSESSDSDSEERGSEHEDSSVDDFQSVQEAEEGSSLSSLDEDEEEDAKSAKEEKETDDEWVSVGKRGKAQKVVEEADEVAEEEDTQQSQTSPANNPGRTYAQAVVEGPIAAVLPRAPPTARTLQSPRRVEYSATDLAHALVDDIFTIIPKLMNSQLVQMMKGDTHASEKALQGYMGFQHLFLSLCREFPVVKRTVETRIFNFINFASCRHKSDTPNIGEFLCLLAVSDEFSFSDVVQPMLEESARRRVRWLLEETPSAFSKLRVPLQESREEMFEVLFKSSYVGNRLLMFHAWFLRNVGRKVHCHHHHHHHSGENDAVCAKASCVEAVYERTHGLPSGQLVSALQKATKDILGVDSWRAFFERCGVELRVPGTAAPPEASLEKMIDAVESSGRDDEAQKEREIEKLQLHLEAHFAGFWITAEPKSLAAGYHFEKSAKGKGKGKGSRR